LSKAKTFRKDDFLKKPSTSTTTWDVYVHVTVIMKFGRGRFFNYCAI
jgi:hypothetical protein